jgi:RNA polymerase sigma factor (sigma-70 family)
LRRAFEAGRKEYGLLPLPFETFARRVIQLARRRLAVYRLAETRERMAEYFAAAAGADLFLASACEEGIPAAWDAFVRRFVPRLFGLARRYGASRSEAEEIARSIPGDVASAPAKGGARTSIGTFDGTGSLFAWLAVQVARRLAARARSRRPISLGGDPPSAGTDPAEICLDAEAESLVGEAVRSAWKDLEEREARALVLRFRDGLTLKEIAPLLGVSFSQVSRILAGAARKIRSSLERRLPEASPAGSAEGERRWNSLREALGRHLQVPSPPDNPPAEDSP